MDNYQDDTRPYWDGLRQKELRVQQCGTCGRRRHYPQPMCPHCHSTEVTWHALGGEGTVHSWTITHQTGIPRFAQQVPYVVATVDMAEGVRVLAPLRGVAHEGLRIGLPVTLVFEAMEDGAMLPAFRAAD